jgi:acyl carrier protein
MVSEKLKQLILHELKLSEFEIQDETTATDVPGWDSLKHINIILEVEKGYNVKFKGLEMMRVRTVGDLQKLIDSKIS